MFITQSSPLLTKQSVVIASRGENVVLSIGNVNLPIHYEHALALSKWIREEAALIKLATRRQQTSRSLGSAHDADAKPKPIVNHKPGVHIKEKLHAWRREDVSSRGRLVCIKIGRNVIDVHFESALKWAQWLRLRAKEARNTAGDVRHWSEIAITADLQTR